jgi:hypothetical protein
VAYLVFIGGVLCPLAWLLGQTVPVLTNLMKHMRTGEASGHALYWSTLGSFLGSVSLSLGVMQWLGVSAAVLACALGLAAGSLALARQQGRAWAGAGHGGAGGGHQPVPAQRGGRHRLRRLRGEPGRTPGHPDPAPSSSTTRWPR